MAAPDAHARYGAPTATKAQGATYTPPALARFMAEALAEAFVATQAPRAAVRCFDPAAGDGALLAALYTALRSRGVQRVALAGCELSPEAARAAEERLRAAGAPLTLHIGDFLDAGPAVATDLAEADLVIANPPYVRAQVLGRERAQRLAQAHGLKGRIDLYQAFLAELAAGMRQGAGLCVLTSNRFLTTRGGAASRALICDRFQVEALWDLGDTRLFGAAVLPALSVLWRSDAPAPGGPPRGAAAMVSAYTTQAPATAAAEDALDALAKAGVVALPDGRRFDLRRGRLVAEPGPGGLWRIDEAEGAAWLAAVEAATWRRFGEVGEVKVGIKTTADAVFIREDWGPTPPELLRPLWTHAAARRWSAGPPRTAVLYPHENSGGRRVAVSLDAHPRARAHLEGHRARLEGRAYLREAKRRWYELWVPQDPEGWAAPKLVFRDIAEGPEFWLDESGAVVNGDCYWLRLHPGEDPDLLWLAMAVANARFSEAFYDRRFHNKLYAGRRRWISQYVKEFPLPRPERSGPIVAAAKAAAKLAADPSRISALHAIEHEIDQLVARAFDLPPLPPLG
jgi:hypothetical protein